MRKKPTPQQDTVNNVPREWLESYAEMLADRGTCPRWVEVMSLLNSNPSTKKDPASTLPAVIHL